MSQYLYLLLTRSNTVVSRAIHHLTSDEFTHISISLDDQLETMYSFCRRYPYFPLPAGLASETISQGFYALHHTIPCQLYRLPVSDQDYMRVQLILDTLMQKQALFKYDILGTILCRLDIGHQRHNHRYCSWFIAELLGQLGILHFNKHYSLIRPIDFTAFPELELLFTGTVGQLASQFVFLKNG